MAPSLRYLDRRAVLDALPLAVPALPFGFVIGVAIMESSMPRWAGWATAPLIFAGAAQLAMVTLAGTASVWAIIAAVFVVNSRHVMYSAALAPAFRDQPRWVRWLGPAVLIDQVFALVSLRPGATPEEFRRYFITVGVVFYSVWNVSVPLGMVVGPVIPESWRLDFAPPVMFVGLVLMGIRRVPAGVAAMVGGIVALMTVQLPDRLCIVVGATAGVVAGAVAEFVVARGESDPLVELARVDR